MSAAWVLCDDAPGSLTAEPLTPDEFFVAMEERVARLAESSAVNPEALEELLYFAEMHEHAWCEDDDARLYLACRILAVLTSCDENMRSSTRNLLRWSADALDILLGGGVPSARALLAHEVLLLMVRSRPDALLVNVFADSSEDAAADADLEMHRSRWVSGGLAVLRQKRLDANVRSRLLQLILQLLYEFCCLRIPNSKFLRLVDQLIRIVDATCYDRDEQLTNDAIRLTLVIHHLLMDRDAEHYVQVGHNPVLKVLARRPETSRSFGECLAFMFNREDRVAVKSMCLELLHTIFSTPELVDYFYANDRSVLVDVLMRNIADLGEGMDELRCLCVRTLSALVRNTQFRHQPHRSRDISRLLRELLNTSQANLDLQLLARQAVSECAEALAAAAQAEYMR
ncbi:hypothetical protein THASP1DRAFT_28216 [Thamnocephalis sphaerospora]|uniref:SPIN90/Ldb17 leucine-rich domain-containing protein n=1 Tax=Thamnocephalis sphaerospora TaxID=78915 RepID=A0A4P9XX19_9FUNG|nr:hypothetical protein THASP1DRAFT_28216 [Thamnocephalis sphaerospora]|eukprot:RKP09990.1 hypothetical protein THASP1DRAFT_28216 [Thamnocephalis sphaerospora]